MYYANDPLFMLQPIKRTLNIKHQKKIQLPNICSVDLKNDFTLLQISILIKFHEIWADIEQSVSCLGGTTLNFRFCNQYLISKGKNFWKKSHLIQFFCDLFKKIPLLKRNNYSNVIKKVDLLEKSCSNI